MQPVSPIRHNHFGTTRQTVGSGKIIELWIQTTARQPHQFSHEGLAVTIQDRKN